MQPGPFIITAMSPQRGIKGGTVAKITCSDPIEISCFFHKMHDSLLFLCSVLGYV